MDDSLNVLPATLELIGKPILPVSLRVVGEKARDRTVEFFTAQIRNQNTREAYSRAISFFFVWMEAKGIDDIRTVRPVHVAAWVENMMHDGLEPATVKQRLAAVRV